MKQLTEWLVYDGYCAMRCIAGSDTSKVENRVAFIEKTPRVRTSPFTDWRHDHLCWEQGPKGSGGPDGHIPENEYYGFYPPSREWCDRRLVELGYALEER